VDATAAGLRRRAHLLPAVPELAEPRRARHVGNGDHVRLRADHADGAAPRDRPYRLKGAAVIAPVAFIAANEIIYWTSWQTVEKLLLAIVAGLVIVGIAQVFGRPMERPPLDARSLGWILP
jgi:hypothetical protein